MNLWKVFLSIPFLCQCVACDDTSVISRMCASTANIIHKAKKLFKGVKKVEEEIAEGAKKIIAEISEDPDEEEDLDEEEAP